MRYRLQLSYDGSNYFGWQTQPNHISVQETIEKAISKISRSERSIVGCGRTDTGVHAKTYFAHFDSPEPVDPEFKYKLNCVLPDDISIHEVDEVDDNWHARFSARKRTYRYYIHWTKNPFLRKYSYYYPFYNIDIDLLNETARILLNYKDFKPLCRVSEDQPSTECDLKHASWKMLDSDQIEFEVSANRFLRNMVRRIVGTSLLISKGKISLEEFVEVMDQQGSFKIVNAAPPEGLFLYSIEY